jgi:hypothetical protein
MREKSRPIPIAGKGSQSINSPRIKVEVLLLTSHANLYYCALGFYPIGFQERR